VPSVSRGSTVGVMDIKEVGRTLSLIFRNAEALSFCRAGSGPFRVNHPLQAAALGFSNARAFQTVEIAHAQRGQLKDMLRHAF
jgi:hypothetical protein